MSRNTLHGRRGWTAVAGLSTVLVVLVVGQLPAAADGAPVTVRSAVEALVPTFGPTAAAAVPELLPVAAPAPALAFPHAVTSAGDRLPGPVRVTALRAAAPARAAAARPASPVAKPAAAKPAAAKPAAAKPAAAKPAAARPAGTAAAGSAAGRPAAPPTAVRAASLCSGEGWQERRGRAALASLKGGAERTGFRVQFKGARSGYLGLTHLDERRIEMFVRSCGSQSGELLRHVMAHELGHAYDTTHMTTATRRAWMAARGIPTGSNWYGCSGCTDFATPAGDFAEVYAQWARGAASNRSRLAGDVPPALLAQLAAQFFGA